MSDKQGAPTLPPLAGGGGNNGTGNSGATQQTVSLQQVLASAQGLNVLTTPAGQQFVITSQVPGLTQVISTGTTTSAGGLQQVGFQRIVNLTGGSPRVSVVGVASASGSPLASPSRQTTTKVVLATSPKLVRTSLGSMFVTPSSTQSSPSQSSPARKKLRLTETTEKTTASDDPTSSCYRRRIMEHKMKRMRAIREKYAENASELFFLHAGGNMMDFQTWKRRPATAQYLHFLRQHRLDPDDDDEDLTVPLPPINTANELVVPSPTSCATTVAVPGSPMTGTGVNNPVNIGGEVKITGLGGTPVAVSTTLPAAVAQLSQQGQIPGRPQGGRHGMVFAIRAAIQSPSQVTVTTTTAHPSPTSTIAPTIIIGGTPLVPEAPKPQPPVAAPPPPPPPPTTTSSSTATTTTSVVCSIVEKSPINVTASSTTTSSTSSSRTTASTTATVATSVSSVASPQPIVKLVKLPSSTVTSTTSSATSSESQNNQEQIVEKAKQEAYVMQRIAELQRDGLWPERRLPKVQEPARTKAHWDYLLEEMVWLAADFAQERKWKKAAAKKCARMVQKHFQEKAIQAQKAEKSHEIRLKKIAGFAAKEIKTFWANVEKLVEFKQQTRLEEKRKKALDQHLNFIVGQTEKYSTWLTEGLNKPEGAQSVPASINSSRISSPVPTNKQHSDDEFEPNQSSEDDEETIAKAEEEMKSTTNHKEEVELLKKESELPLEDLLKELPPNYLEERDKSLSPVAKETVEDENDATADGDTEFTVASDESSDDENTIMEQEKAEGNANHQKELDELKAENDMSIDELMAKYGNMPATPMEVDGDTDQESGEDSDKDEAEQNDDKSESDSESEDETKADEEGDSQTHSDDETDVGLKSLLEDLSSEKPEDKNKTVSGEQCENHNEMDDVAALAESIQPKGNTLLTTSVVTKIPFLLKHSLREYQHIGLDWLTTMYERKLNGILADEMGLGKTIQTIALLAHLACEKGNWGPHLIIVPTSVMLNWEMECKKWCPGFKILTYYGTQKERKQKRTGWTKPNAFHICITSYKLVIQDHQSFRRKKWKYLILDEAQNIKNFKSQRWQLLLNFQTQRRLLLTGTPLQNNLMELWSLMHFLMPNVFQSHREFKEWFSNPVTGMIEGNSEYNENIIRRLHKVLRPFLLRRLKTEVEKQLPKKYEHVIMCRLSKRQRYLYDDFMSRAKTKETLASGNLLSVINVLMQLRKVCNHPNLFEVRPTVSPFQMEAIEFVTASLAWSALDYHPFKSIDLSCLNLFLVNLEFTLTAFVAHRVRRLQTPRRLIEEIDSLPEPPPRCPSGKIKINVRLSNQTKAPVAPPPPVQPKVKNVTGIVPNPRVGTSPLIKTLNNQSTPPQGVTLRVAGGQQLQGYSVQLVQHQGSVKAIPVATLAHNPQGAQNVTTTSSAGMNAQRITMGGTNIRDGLQRLTTQTVTVKQGDSLQRIAVPSFAQLVQTSTGRHIILTSNQQNTNTVSFPVMTPGGQRLTVLSKPLMGLSTANKVVGSVVTTTTNAGGRVGMRVPPLNVNTSPGQNLTGLQQPQQPSQQPQLQQPQQLRCGIVARTPQKEAVKAQIKEQPKSEFYLPQLEEDRRQRRQSKLRTIATINERRCAACPLYGEDLFTALRIGKPVSGCQWHNGPTNCATAKETPRTRRQFFSRTEALAAAIKSTEQIVEELKGVFQRFVVYVPAVRAPVPRFHVSHPPPHKAWTIKRSQIEIERVLAPKMAILHPVAGAMMTQFPDPRLIQYDCGKLQSLDRLLRKLKTGNHRVLIFTQMTRMLDVLEAFLNFHGHIYLRLDGATRVDQRQVLMERFNGDKRIFCFILSTRSGGVGVNLTGADTVIFYDSDWNPTMDAQAQDRCHRIGQTRDVHIYRLVSEKTVEENILKKANQKRLLGDLAIEGGNFTTAYFKSSTIQDLFNVDQTENDASARMADVLDQSRDRTLHRESAATASTFIQPNEEKVAIGALESALAAAEEDLDVQAAKTAKAEAVADLAEFDENIPLDDADKEDAQVSKAEQEVQNLVSQLTPVERYAMKFVEQSEGTFSAAQLAAAERELEEQKKEWELDRLRALREEEERRLRLADDDEKPLTFGREDSQNQVNSKSSVKRVTVKRGAIRKTATSPGSQVGAASTATRRGGSSRRGRRRPEESVSESSTSTTTDSDDSDVLEDDLVEDSPDEESSHTESQSQGDEEDEDDDVENDDDNDDQDRDDEDQELRENHHENERGSARGGGFTKRRNGTKKSNDRNSRNNRWDLNSPRTRSRGNVKINLWTLDVSPILPGVKPNFRNRGTGRRGRKKFGRKKSDDVFARPISPRAKRNRSTGEEGGSREGRVDKIGRRSLGVNGEKEVGKRDLDFGEERERERSVSCKGDENVDSERFGEDDGEEKSVGKKLGSRCDSLEKSADDRGEEKSGRKNSSSKSEVVEKSADDKGSERSARKNSSSKSEVLEKSADDKGSERSARKNLCSKIEVLEKSADDKGSERSARKNLCSKTEILEKSADDKVSEKKTRKNSSAKIEDLEKLADAKESEKSARKNSSAKTEILEKSADDKGSEKKTRKNSSAKTEDLEKLADAKESEKKTRKNLSAKTEDLEKLADAKESEKSARKNSSAKTESLEKLADVKESEKSARKNSSVKTEGLEKLADAKESEKSARKNSSAKTEDLEKLADAKELEKSARKNSSLSTEILEKSADDKLSKKIPADEVSEKSADDEVLEKSADDEILEKSADDEILEKSADDEVSVKSADDELSVKSADDEILKKPARKNSKSETEFMEKSADVKLSKKLARKNSSPTFEILEKSADDKTVKKVDQISNSTLDEEKPIVPTSSPEEVEVAAPTSTIPSQIVNNISNIEILLAEKMSEISSSMESSQSDESAEHERSCAFSPDSKSLDDESFVELSSIITPDSSRIGIVLSDIVATSNKKIDTKIEKKSQSQTESGKTPRPTRSRPMSVKRLTQTFDASFDESGVSANFETESISGNPSSKRTIHVTRSSHKVTANFSRNTENHEETNKIDETIGDSSWEKSVQVRDTEVDKDHDEDDDLLPIQPILAREDSVEASTSSKPSPSTRLTKRPGIKTSSPEPEKSCSAGTLTDMRPSPSTRSTKRPGMKTTSPEPETSWSAEILNEMIGSSSSSRSSPSTRSAKRPGIKTSSPERENSWSAETLNEMIGASSQRRRSVATRSRNKIHLEDIARSVESAPREKLSIETSRTDDPRVKVEPTVELPSVEPEVVSRVVKQELISNDLVEKSSVEPDEKIVMPPVDEKKVDVFDKFAVPSLNKLSSEVRVRLRRPDTPLPGVITRRAKSIVPEASTSSPTVHDTKFSGSQRRRRSPDGRRITRLNSTVEHQESDSSETSPRATPSAGRISKQPEIQIGEPSSARVTTRSTSTVRPGSPPTLVPMQSCTITLKPLQRKTLEALVESSTEIASNRPKTRSSEIPSKTSSPDRPTTRSTRPGLDNGFLMPQTSQNYRKSKSIETAGVQVARPTRKISGDPDHRITTLKRRPDTPLPGAEGIARVTRSGVDFNASNSRTRSQRDARNDLDTDTNGNALHEEFSKTSHEEAATASDGGEKPQRTAKVIAILTLDSSSRASGKTGNSATCPRRADEADGKIISVVDLDSESEGESVEPITRRSGSRRSLKRARVGNIANKIQSVGKVETDIQVVDIDDEEEFQCQPTRKIVKMQSSTNDRLNSSAS